MDNIDPKSKLPRKPRDASTRSQENQHVEEKRSPKNHHDEDLEFASPTSAPPKLYSGSLFLYTNDPFGCFTNDGHEIKDDKHYNNFFSLTKLSKEGAHRKQDSLSQGDGDNFGSRHEGGFGVMLHESRSDCDTSDIASRQNSSMADARLSPDRLDHATNKAINDIFEDGCNSNRDHHNKLKVNTGKHKGEREFRGYNSPKRQKENRQFPQAPHQQLPHQQPHAMMMPQMGYMQTPYMGMPNQPYMGQMTQGYGYPVPNNDFNRVNQQYPRNNYYNAYDSYDNYSNEQERPESSHFGNNIVNRHSNNNNQNSHKDHDLKKDNNGSQNSRNNNNNNNSQQNYKKDKRQQQRQSENSDPVDLVTNKQSGDTDSLTGDQPSSTSTIDPEKFQNLIQNAAELAKDQTGCRMLQKEIESGDLESVSKIFDGIIEGFSGLMVDPFGNYLCQKIAEICETSQMKRIIEVVSHDLPEICFNPHGTRAVQKLIEVVKDQELIEMLVKSLSKDVVGLVKDNNGNHVVQKCLTSMSDDNKQFIYDSIVKNCIDVATHKHGCCVIQRCFDHASRKQKGELTQVVAENSLELVKDQYGNYVVQYVLEMKDTEPRIRQRIADELAEDVVELSKQKFSSNVVEKCLSSGIGSFRDNFMELMLNDDMLVEMVCDKFANYVLQRFLANADENERNQILQTVGNNADIIRNDPFGQKIYAKLAKAYNLLNDDSLSNMATSPLFSENSQTNSTRTSNTRTDNRNHNDSNRYSGNRRQQQQYGRNNGGDRRNNNTTGKNYDNNGGRGRRYSNNNQQQHMNQHGHSTHSHNAHHNTHGGHQNTMPKGVYNQQGMQNGPMMYPPMRNDMMQPQPSFGPMMTQPGFYMPQPQMYNQYYNYPTPPQQGMYYPKIY